MRRSRIDIHVLPESMEQEVLEEHVVYPLNELLNELVGVFTMCTGVSVVALHELIVLLYMKWKFRRQPTLRL